METDLEEYQYHIHYCICSFILKNQNNNSKLPHPDLDDNHCHYKAKKLNSSVRRDTILGFSLKNFTKKHDINVTETINWLLVFI